MRAVLAVIGALAVLGFFLSFGLEASFTSRAKPTEIVQRTPETLKHGGEGYRVLDPTQSLVIDDPKAFLPGFGDQGQLLADAAYLKSAGETPIPLQSVETMAWLARAGCLLACAASLLGWVYIPRLMRPPLV